MRSHLAPKDNARESRASFLACTACGHRIASAADGIEVGGGHAHTFTNPDGLRFRIGCFARAPGCSCLGEPSTYWAWFPGYAWQVENCGSCREHLGWLFRSPAHAFHGLILDRLIEVQDD